MTVMEAIQKRRSARSYLDKPIEDEVLLELLEAARLAPSGGNGQNHVFGVVKDQEIKLALARSAGNQMWIAEAPVVIACCARLEEDLKGLPESDFGLRVNELRFTKPFIQHLNAYPDRKAVGALFVNAAPLIPAEHMVLAAAAHGIQGCYIGWLDVWEASRVLNLPGDMVCLFLLPLGYPKREPSKKKRKSLDEISFFNRYEK